MVLVLIVSQFKAPVAKLTDNRPNLATAYCNNADWFSATKIYYCSRKGTDRLKMVYHVETTY
jgi:hypothetical protein